MRRVTRSARMVAALGAAGLAVALFPAGAAVAYDSGGFESGYTAGASINGQHGWTVRDQWGNDAWGNTGPAFDEEVTTTGSGNTVWRVSNAVTSSGFSAQPYSPVAPAVAGETGAALWNDKGADSTHPLSPPNPGATATTSTFHAGFRFKSATGGSQPGLSMTVSPSAKQSSWRMSYLNIADNGSTGFNLGFYQTGAYPDHVWDPTTVPVASGLAYNQWHTVDLYIHFKDGLNSDGTGNDVVNVVVDGNLVDTGTTWESYYHQNNPAGLSSGDQVQAVDSLLFRLAGAAAPSTAGEGFYVDDVVVDNAAYVSDSTPPVVSDVTATPNPVSVAKTATLTAKVDDSGTGDSTITGAEYRLNDGAWAPMTASDGSFDSSTENVTADVTAPATPDLYNVCVRGTDAAGNTSGPACTTLVAYDPSGGFVTGGGWIDSPPGAYGSNGAVTVTPSNMQGWGFVDDNGNGGTGQMVSGPASPPLGSGSAELSVDDTTQGYALATAAYAGTPLADISDLGYSSYQPGPTLAIALQFDVKYRTSDTSYDGRLVYEPYQNGHVTVGSGWQSWSPLDGIWWASHTGPTNGTNGLCPISAPCDWSTILSDFPDATISGGVLFKAGSGWSSFDGNVDAFTIGVNGTDTTYDFEASAGPTGMATFGFVSKYKKGASTPTGNTVFKFKAAGLSFSSDSYDWLVINHAGTNAQFKGTGSLNGAPGYQFMVWATDNGSTGDLFRIRINDPSGNTVYDNGVKQEIGGGSIIVHK